LFYSSKGEKGKGEKQGEKGTGYFSVERVSARMLEALVPRIPGGQQGGYAYHVISEIRKT
jgi:hypothetical protein